MTSFVQNGDHNIISRPLAARCSGVRWLPAIPPSACDVISWSILHSYLFYNKTAIFQCMCEWPYNGVGHTPGNICDNPNCCRLHLQQVLIIIIITFIYWLLAHVSGVFVTPAGLLVIRIYRLQLRFSLRCWQHGLIHGFHFPCTKIEFTVKILHNSLFGRHTAEELHSYIGPSD